MKKLSICMMTVLLSLTFIPTKTNASPTPTTTTADATNSSNALEAHVLITRLDEIKSIDKSNLSFSEKRSLRLEVKGIKNRLKDIGGGVYLSAGAIILIIILLVIFL